ncbi:MAG: ABC transporter substrate-binding protein [Gemmatimonas sp.]|uniref:ABC transporter substrate-binding protein n=1 Tax=Gemmatimonas sp. TaxID=1962908 RepID=UPI0025BDA5FB|nr:helical backbone metal receptor [Gemmatimonas sp.]MCE2953537.1 helical backbone metal receptor [Gemmatimonas sp.]
MFPHPRLVRRARRWLVLVPGIVVAACGDSSRSSSAAGAAEASRVPSAVAHGVRAIAPADTDDFGVALPIDARYARRVVSLNPAATEAVFAIGADSVLVGRSRWDRYPAAVARVPAIADGLRPSLEAVLAARPTLVVLYATAENRAVADALTRAGVRTIALRVDRIAHFHRQLRVLGVALGASSRAAVVSDSVQRTLDRVRAQTARLAGRPAVVWPVWSTPPMVIGGGSYMDELLEIAGARNVFHDAPQPSPSVSMEEIIARAPQYVMASDTQMASLGRDDTWRALPAVRAQQFVRHDPAVTGRPSVVLGMAAVQLARALHPTLADSLP